MTLTVLVTGGSRGIGNATARLAGSRGWNVGVNYVSNSGSAESAVKAIKDHGGQAISLQGDVSQEADVLRLFDSMEAEFGALQGVVINAGITAPKLPLAEMSIERLRQVFDTNVLGSYLCAREGARRLPKDSSIVIISSAAARLGSPNEFVDYAGSKGAMDTLVVGLSKELGPKGIRVNGVRPGIINTDIHASDPGRVAKFGDATPLGRPGEASEVAEAIVWLLSPAASYVTGTIIDVAGGR